MAIEDHNPDSSCVECCELNASTNELITEIHSVLMPLIVKVTAIADSFDKDKLEGLMNSPLLKMLGKFGG